MRRRGGGDLANGPRSKTRRCWSSSDVRRNLLAAEPRRRRHHVALSMVGSDRTPDSGYFRAKVAQEKLIEASGIPYTIIRSTQFLEFLKGIADSSMEGDKVRVSPGLFQPIAADDVAAMVADVALAPAAQRHRRDRRVGTRALQRDRRPLSEGGRRPPPGRARSRGALFRWPRSRSTRSCPWAKRVSAASVWDEWLRRSRT